MIDTLPAWASRLGLQPHPEGGWYAETYRAPIKVETDRGPRATMTSVLFLLMPGEKSAWHRLASDELWVHQRGGALEMLIAGTRDRPVPPERHLLGTGSGAQPQVLVPARHWQSARPLSEPVLVANVVTPGFDFDDFELLS